MKINNYPRSWTWAASARPRNLSMWSSAPETNGFYELGFVNVGSFQAMYCGRAAVVTLKSRLRQHFYSSHNLHIRRYSPELWYRYKSFGSAELAMLVEAVHIAAMDYPWNKRNEWTQHWALEI